MIELHAASHTGSVRARNEDSFGATRVSHSTSDGQVVSATVRGSNVFAVVADGLGGHPCGDVASRIAVDTVLEAAPVSADALVVAVHEANAAIVAAMSDADGSVTMGTTLAAVVIDGDELGVVNVGDSTVFALVDGALEQLSVDDSPRGGDSSFVTQTLGGGVELEEVAPHLHLDDLDAVQRVLLCTDGLTNFVPLELIGSTLRDHAGATAVEVLIAATLAAGAPDNVTVVVIDLESLG